MATGGRYDDEPPAQFPCGHPRADGNIAFNGNHAACKICRTAYMQAHNKQYKARRLVAQRLAGKPHLYPNTPTGQ